MTIVPVLLYHGVVAAPSARMAPFTVPPEAFARHMDLIAERGLRCLTVSGWIDERRAGIPSDGVALVTFDDGYLDFLESALPVMLERSIPSTLYVTTGWIDGGSTPPLPRPADPMLRWDQLPELEEGGVELGAHSHSHPQMDTLGTAAAWDELARSKSLLEDALGHPVRSFAYPHGYNSPRLRRQVRDVGFDSAAAVVDALSHDRDHELAIARLTLKATTTDDEVAAWLDGSGAPVASEERLRTKGWRAYRRAKAVLRREAGTDYR